MAVEVDGDPGAAAQAIEGQVAAKEISTSGSVLRVTVEEGDRAIADVIRALDASGINLRSISLARPSLDDVFLTLTGRSLREEGETDDATAT